MRTRSLLWKGRGRYPRKESFEANSMRNVTLIGEDYGHETAIKALLDRYILEHGIVAQTAVLSCQGGMPKVHFEFGQYLDRIDKGHLDLPDLIVVATDSNCAGYTNRRKQMEKVTNRYAAIANTVAYAIPDPHVERWLLADPNAFKKAVGKGCAPLPKLKCNKDEYKDLLYKSVRETGVNPVLGGLEYAEDIMKSANLALLEQSEPSFQLTAKQIKGFLQQWRLE